jgi:hypothetical protein
VPAKISFPHSPKQGIADGMDQNIGIRMAQEPFVVGYLNTPENQWSTCAQRMHIVPVSDPYLRRHD